ncbi:hypothetical protein M8J75_012091 [Diaphorina citri]|nr:hypothetical protein M8J75_012091 [Diaphorina citri]
MIIFTISAILFLLLLLLLLLRCSPPGQKTEYQKAYALWCHEFQKYKSAMKTWEKKEAQCGRRTNETLTIGGQNTHPNEIFHGSPIV